MPLPETKQRLHLLIMALSTNRASREKCAMMAGRGDGRLTVSNCGHDEPKIALSSSRLAAGVSSLPRAARMDATAMVDGWYSTELISANGNLSVIGFGLERRRMWRGKEQGRPLIAANTHSTARRTIGRRSSCRNRAAKQLM
jgi:hypothetical protein